jgi:hypothetical protein
MPDLFPALFIAVFIIVAAAAVIGGYLYQRKRREELSALARELGLRFDYRKDRSHDKEYRCFEVFRRGSSRAAYNTLSGNAEVRGVPCRVKMGDFTYTVSSGKNSTTYRFSYLILYLPVAGVPELLIRPEGLFDKLSGFFGFSDIEFESAEFNRRFHVRSPDKRFAYDVITPRMMEFLLGSPSVTVDIEAGRCCITDGTKTWSPAVFRQRLAWVGRFIELWPRHVVESRGLRGAAS